MKRRTDSERRRSRRRIAEGLALVALSLALLGSTWPAARNVVSGPFPLGLHPYPDAPGAQNLRPAPTPAPTKRAAGNEGHLKAGAAVRHSTSIPARYLVLFVLDGARPDYFNVPNTPHLHALMQAGTLYTNAFAGILESETPSGHATIASGAEPRQDGILSFAWANDDNTTVNLFDPKAIDDGQMEQMMKVAPAPTIGELVKAKDPKATVVALGGHKYYADDALGGPAADAIMYYTGTTTGQFVPVAVPGHVPPKGVLNTPGLTAPKTSLPIGVEDKLVMRLVQTTFTHMKPRVMLVNMPEFDWPLGHVLGADRDPKDVRKLMHEFDTGLGKLESLYRKAGILDKTVFVVTADHGFAPIYHTIDKDQIDAAVAKAGTTIISDTYHTAGYMWLKDSTKNDQAAQNIAHLQNPAIQSVYFKSVVGPNHYKYLRATGPDLFLTPGMEAANQYLLQTFNGPDGPDLVTFFREDTASLPGGEASWKGDHGGADWESQHVPLLIAGAGVRHGVVSSQPARLMDIAPTALALLGVPSTGMQGIRLADAMQNASAADTARERAVARELNPIVAALQREAALEVKASR